MSTVPKDEAESQKRDTVLRRMLETPPKPHGDKEDAKQTKNKTPAK